MAYISSSKERCELLAMYLVEHESTVRAVAAHFGISKSTVHKDISNNLKHINKQLYYRAQEIMQINKQERHLRGGEATKNKYKLYNQKYKNV